jgi:dolichol kinase
MMENLSRDMTVGARANANDKVYQQIEYKNELARKAIHLVSISIPLVYVHTSKEFALTVLIPVFLGFLTMDIVKLFVKPVREWYLKYFAAMLRPHELDYSRRNFNGATYVSLAAVLVVLLFPKMIAIAAFAILIISDTAAALVGRKFGKTKLFSKTLEGSFAFFITAMVVVVFVPKLSLIVGLAIALAGTLAELLPIKIFGHQLDDNITIPLVSGVVGLLSYMLFLPQDLVLLN